MTECIFCRVIAGELPSTKAYEDNDTVVFADIHPQAPVHWLVVPKSHISEFIAADSATIAKLMAAIHTVVEKEKITQYRIVANGKGVAVVDHLHFHLMGNIDKLRKL